jgi:hypothetical protein
LVGLEKGEIIGQMTEEEMETQKEKKEITTNF